jgi:hypothetical protein
MPATSKQRAALDLYCVLMEEAKHRLACIDGAVDGQTGLPYQAVAEFCFLQLRMLCELIALACLTAHGDVNPGAKLRKAYAADEIIGHLGKLHPPFYPHAMKSGGPYKIEAIKNGFLTKSELPNLYHRCGSMLHRGTLKTLFDAKAPIGDTLAEIKEWRKKIVVLLRCHGICLFDDTKLVIFTFANPVSNRVTWAMFEGEPKAKHWVS